MDKHTLCNGCPDERWAQVPGWEDAYKVSTCGRVMSVDRTVNYSNGTVRVHKGRLLKPWLNSGIYPAVRFSRNGQSLNRTIHSLVLESFVGPRPPQCETLHIDSLPTNSHLSNLKWGTRSENVLDEVHAGTHRNVRKSHCPQGHPLVEPNIVAHHLRLGVRACLACNNAHSEITNAKRKGIDISDQLQSISDKRFAKIMD